LRGLDVAVLSVSYIVIGESNWGSAVWLCRLPEELGARSIGSSARGVFSLETLSSSSLFDYISRGGKAAVLEKTIFGSSFGPPHCLLGANLGLVAVVQYIHFMMNRRSRPAFSRTLARSVYGRQVYSRGKSQDFTPAIGFWRPGQSGYRDIKIKSLRRSNLPFRSETPDGHGSTAFNIHYVCGGRGGPPDVLVNGLGKARGGRGLLQHSRPSAAHHRVARSS